MAWLLRIGLDPSSARCGTSFLPYQGGRGHVVEARVFGRADSGLSNGLWFLIGTVLCDRPARHPLLSSAASDRRILFSPAVPRCNGCRGSLLRNSRKRSSRGRVMQDHTEKSPPQTRSADAESVAGQILWRRNFKLPDGASTTSDRGGGSGPLQPQATTMFTASAPSDCRIAVVYSTIRVHHALVVVFLGARTIRGRRRASPLLPPGEGSHVRMAGNRTGAHDTRARASGATPTATTAGNTPRRLRTKREAVPASGIDELRISPASLTEEDGVWFQLLRQEKLHLAPTGSPPLERIRSQPEILHYRWARADGSAKKPRGYLLGLPAQRELPFDEVLADCALLFLQFLRCCSQSGEPLSIFSADMLAFQIVLTMSAAGAVVCGSDPAPQAWKLHHQRKP